MGRARHRVISSLLRGISTWSPSASFSSELPEGTGRALGDRRPAPVTRDRGGPAQYRFTRGRIAGLSADLSVREQPKHDHQCDQPDDAVIAEALDYPEQVFDNVAGREPSLAEENLNDDDKGDQKQANLGDLADPILDNVE